MTVTATTLSILLDRVRCELDKLGDIVGDMQIGLSPLLSRISTDEADAYRHAQNLDLLGQTLESLSHVLTNLAQESASDEPIDIGPLARSLPLAGLAARLRGETDAGQAADQEFDLF